MRSQHTQDFFQVVIFLVITGGSAIIHAFRKMNLSRKIEDTATAPIGSAPQGTVELQGYAWPLEVVTSPVSQKKCVFYKLIIEEERKNKNNTTWVKVFEGQSGRPFAIVDRTGYAVVFPEGSEINAIPHRYGSLTEPQRLGVQTVLDAKQSKVKIESGFFTGKKRYIENVICPGTPLYVLGNFKTIAGFRPYPLFNGCDVFMSKTKAFSPGVAMAQGESVDLKDTHLMYETLAEQCVKFESVEQVSGENFQSMGSNVSPTPSPYAHDAGVLVHSTDNPLYIADAHQNELLKRIGNYNWLQIAGGAFLLAVAAALLFHNFYVQRIF